MSDITKCTNDRCPIKHTCYRWTAPADPIWQSYAYFEPNGYSELSGDQMTNYYDCDYGIFVHKSAPFINREQVNK